jgi:hypothetical protein
MSSQSQLLELPAELRNHTCEFSLTSPRNLHLQICGAGGKHTNYRITPLYCYYAKERTEFNQLKNVSKQLFAEARGLELLYNDIEIWADNPEDSPAEFLLDWVSTFSHAIVRWIRKVILKYNLWGPIELPGDIHVRKYPETATTLVRLTRICEEVPGMNVQYHLPAWDLHSYARPTTSIPYAVEQVMALRRELAVYKVAQAISETFAPEWSFRKAQFAGRWRQKVTVEDLQADNLKYYPVGPLCPELAEETIDTVEDGWIELWPGMFGNMQQVKDKFRLKWLVERLWLKMFGVVLERRMTTNLRSRLIDLVATGGSLCLQESIYLTALTVSEY